MQIKLKFDSRLANRWADRFSRQRINHAARVLAPTLLALSLTTVAHAQGTMDFSGAQTLMGTFNNRFAYVSVSRASHDAQVYTNDANSLAKTLSHNMTKTSAIEIAEVANPNAVINLERSIASSSASGIGLGMSL
jgi:hypothetical protein